MRTSELANEAQEDLEGLNEGRSDSLGLDGLFGIFGQDILKKKRKANALLHAARAELGQDVLGPLSQERVQGEVRHLGLGLAS